jgi:hypothetical protein
MTGVEVYAQWKGLIHTVSLSLAVAARRAVESEFEGIWWSQELELVKMY